MRLAGAALLVIAGCGAMLVCGCGRLAFDPRVDANNDGSALDDGSLIGPDIMPLAGCWPRWRDHTIAFDPPRELTEINDTALSDLDPFLSSDQLQLFWVVGVSGSRDILHSARPAIGSAFGGFVLRDDISSPQDDGKVSMTDDELELVISVDRTGSQAYDLWSASRADTSALFGDFTLAPYVNVNTATNERDPFITRDGLRLYYAAGTNPGQELRVAVRGSRSEPFGTSATVTDLGMAITADPMVSRDELVIIYVGQPDMASTGHLFYATRSSTSEPFGNAQMVPDINSTAIDGDPHKSDDGCELFFGSARSGDRDLYLATVR